MRGSLIRAVMPAPSATMLNLGVINTPDDKSPAQGGAGLKLLRVLMAARTLSQPCNLSWMINSITSPLPYSAPPDPAGKSPPARNDCTSSARSWLASSTASTVPLRWP